MSDSEPAIRFCKHSRCDTVLVPQEKLFEWDSGKELCDKHEKRLHVYGPNVYKPNPGGYRTQVEGSFYLILNEDLQALGFGITNTTIDRIASHEEHGWTGLGEWRWHDGSVAKGVETHIKTYLRDNGLAPAVSKADMPQQGYTETVALTDLSLPEICDLIDKAIAAVAGPEHQLNFEVGDEISSPCGEATSKSSKER